MAQYFTPTFKQRLRVTGAAVTMLAGALPFVAGLLAMQHLGDQPSGALPALVALLSFLLGGLLPWLSQNMMGLAGNSGLRRRLQSSLGTACRLDGCVFVGFSPGDDLRVWHGETDRDVGFLGLTDTGLVYYGDDYRWSLPHELIQHIDLAPAEGGLQRIVIHWQVPREVMRQFSLESREAASISGVRRATQALHTRMREWQKSAGPAVAADGPMADANRAPALGLPPTDLTGGQIVDQPASGSCVSILGLGVIMLILIWRISGAFFAWGRYYEGVLWAGLISVLGALGMAYLLHYLQAWEAEHGRQAQRER
jgi:hypothetical protein